jgi:hypothetical protein
VLALVGYVGWERLFVHPKVPGAPYTVEAAYGPVHWSNQALVINYVQSNWQSFQRLDVQPAADGLHIRVLFTQIDNLSQGEPTYTWRSQTLHLEPGETRVYVGGAIVNGQGA